MKTAIITGASSGLGRHYALALRAAHPEIEEYWLIARRVDRLEALKGELGGVRVKTLGYDLGDMRSFESLSALLAEQKPDVSYLINNAGFGKLGDFADIPPADEADMVLVNCAGLTAMTRAVLPYMGAGAGVLMVSSIAAFVPNARMAVYSSTKAYVFSLAKALRFELKDKKINVLAACPGPMETEFLAVADIPKGRSRTFDLLPRVKPERMARRSLRALDEGRGVYTDRAFYKFYRVLAKLLPNGWLMPAAKC